MDRKYIMLDSTYRDRFLYPNPAEFIVSINNPVGNNVFNSRNPLLDGYPIHNCCFLSETPFVGTIIGGNSIAIQVDASIDNLTGLSNPTIGTTLDEANDMFLNLTVEIAGDTNVYRVTGYDPVRHIISLDTPVLNLTIGGQYTLSNQSTSSSIVLQGYETSYLGTTTNQDGYFISNKIVYVWDMTLNVVRSGFLKEYNINLTEPFPPEWNITDRYAFSLAPALDMGTFSGLAPGSSQLNTGLWRFDISEPGTGYTNQMEVQIVVRSESRPEYCIAVGRIIFITSNSGISRMELLYCGDQYVINGEYYILPVGETFRPDLGRLVVVATATGYQIESNNKTSLIGNYFMPILFTPEFRLDPTDPTLLQLSPNNSLPFVPNRIINNLSSVDANSFNGVVPIVDVFYYNDKQIILTQHLNNELYQRFQCSNIDSFPESYYYQILPFYRDGYVSMDYRGTTVSSNQMVCYQLSVNTLILPNQILNLPFGALTSSYPYVLLEITNETASSGHNKSIIYSNNPNTINATFVCSISDVNSPTITKFININSDRSNQILKFKPNDNLKFRISMPDGRTFETEIKDYLPPLAPNPLLQINCLIEIVRL